MQSYFNFVYNPVYDFTTAQISSYGRLQETCVNKFQFEDGDRLLCVGVGTGNEMLRIWERDRRIRITGVDTSGAGLRRAREKALRGGEGGNVLKMDAQNLGFDDGSFDKAFCHHLMGFLDDDRQATREILRVLKTGGQFVITYPSGAGGWALLAEVLQSVLRSIRSRRFGRGIAEFLAVTASAIVNVPIAFWVRPKQGFYSRYMVERLLWDSQAEDYRVEQDEVYQDFVVYGRKDSDKGGNSHAA